MVAACTTRASVNDAGQSPASAVAWYVARVTAPRSHRLEIRHLSTHVLEWTVPATIAVRGTVLLLHGFADAAGSFDLVAPALAAAGYRVIAPDLRGFGETAWIPAGAYYHFPEYVADVDALVAALDLTNLLVVGHSMGGTVATLFAGARPKKVCALALLEGLGPPDTDLSFAPDRFTKWLDDLTAPRHYEQKPIDDAAGVLARLALQHPDVDRGVLASRVDVLSRVLPDGRRAWRFDPLHRSTSPTPFLGPMYRAFLGRITVPTLVLGGGPSGYHPPEEPARIAALVHHEHHELEGAGHMMHWTKPDAVVARLLAFFAAQTNADA